MKAVWTLLFLIFFFHYALCWTTEDLELFDLVESTPRNFYDVLGVDQKASPSDIRKAYRKLSTLYHPDKNKNSDAEETFRRIAAVADVLRNDERRKTYDLILKTGLPDWRVPIYYYRRVRNMGLFELTIFLFGLATLGQYLFAWSAYWEKKFEIEEVVLSKIRKKAKHQKKGKSTKLEDDATVTEVMSTLQKPRCQDLFPIRLFYFIIYLIKSSPSYVASCRDYFKLRRSEVDDDDDEEPQEIRLRHKKQTKPKIPDYSSVESYIDCSAENADISKETKKNEGEIKKKKWSWDNLNEQQIQEFKKALKKFPNGTLQRWEKVAAYLDCSVAEVVSMVKELKNQTNQSKNVPISMQGVTGTEKENYGFELYEEKGKQKDIEDVLSGNNQKNSSINGSVTGSILKQNGCKSSEVIPSQQEKIWKQEEQRSLELALQKYPKDMPARWDKIAGYVSTKTKEECIERFKILAQQVKKRKDKNI